LVSINILFFYVFGQLFVSVGKYLRTVQWNCEKWWMCSESCDNLFQASYEGNAAVLPPH